jgi:hypothetical protein
MIVGFSRMAASCLPSTPLFTIACAAVMKRSEGWKAAQRQRIVRRESGIAAQSPKSTSGKRLGNQRVGVGRVGRNVRLVRW